MKTLILALAVAALAIGALAAPYSVDGSWTSGTTNTLVVAESFKPTQINMWGVLPEAWTATVSRVHGTLVQTVTTVTNASGSGTITLSTAPWFVPGDQLRIVGPTNATFEVQGDQ